MRCLAETLAATDEASPRLLAMIEEGGSKNWEKQMTKDLEATLLPLPSL